MNEDSWWVKLKSDALEEHGLTERSKILGGYKLSGIVRVGG